MGKKKEGVVSPEIQRAIAKIKRLDVKQRELQTEADLILSTSAVGQAPPVYHRAVDKAIEVTKQKAKIWNEEIRNKVIPETGRTYWQTAIEARLPTVDLGKEKHLDFFAENIEAMAKPRAENTPRISRRTVRITPKTPRLRR